MLILGQLVKQVLSLHVLRGGVMYKSPFLIKFHDFLKNVLSSEKVRDTECFISVSSFKSTFSKTLCVATRLGDFVTVQSHLSSISICLVCYVFTVIIKSLKTCVLQ